MNTRRIDPEIARALAEVNAVYAELAQRPVERECVLRAGCCQFKLTGRVPHLTRGEAIIAARALRATGRRRLPERSDGACPMLTPEGRCLIYNGRPFGCRTEFCRAAGGPYDRRTVVDLIRRLEDADAKLGGNGAHPLADAVGEELRNP